MWRWVRIEDRGGRQLRVSCDRGERVCGGEGVGRDFIDYFGCYFGG